MSGDGSSNNDGTATQISSPGRNTLGSSVESTGSSSPLEKQRNSRRESDENDLGNNSMEDEENDDDDVDIYDNEHHELFHLSGENRSTSIASSDDDTADDFSLRRWRSVLTVRSSNSGHNKHHPSSPNYEYGQIDEDMLNRRGGGGTGGVFPGTRLKLLFGVVLAIFVAAMFIPNDKSVGDRDAANTKPVARKYKGAPQYVCPTSVFNDDATTSSLATLQLSKEDFANHHTFVGYRNNSDLINLVTTNTSVYKANFRNAEYMDWNKTYNQVKEAMKEYKSSRFLPNLKTGDSIFESGCGIGLSLLLTAELLQDDNVRDLHLYGTDFGVVAANTANLLLDAVLSEASNVGGGKRGAVCAAESTQLSFIPDGSFDFVFASRISPQPDPWEDVFNATIAKNPTSLDDVLERRRDICSTKGIEWKSAALYEMALERQMIWYGQWVSEMIRIAKPGVPIVIEHVSDPFCDHTGNSADDVVSNVDEWGGGVPRSFWSDSVTRFNWDVDSLDYESDVLFPDKHRYHVFMRKRHRLVD